MICQLYVMQHEWHKPILTRKEVQTFILMHLRLKTMTEEEVKAMPMNFVPSPRSVQLATIYTGSILENISESVGDVVNRRNLLPCNNFEGRFFQTLYKEIHDFDIRASPDETVDLEVFYGIVTSKGTKVSM